MLPGIILWGWSFCGAEDVIVPIVISLIFTLSCVGLLVCALKERVSFFWAVLAGVFLVSIPIYTMHGTSQYADVLLAYFILASSVLILDLFEAPLHNTAVLAGLFLGFAACTKDNGIMATLLLSVLIIGRLRKTASLRVLIRPFGWGLTAVMVSVFLMKSFDALNVGNHTYDIFWSGLCAIQRWLLIGGFIGKSFTDSVWGLLWPLAFLVLLFCRGSLVQEGVRLVIKFMLLYMIFYLFVYAGTVLELKWLLEVSWNRLLYLLAPTVVFVTFYALGKGKYR